MNKAELLEHYKRRREELREREKEYSKKIAKCQKESKRERNVRTNRLCDFASSIEAHLGRTFEREYIPAFLRLLDSCGINSDAVKNLPANEAILADKAKKAERAAERARKAAETKNAKRAEMAQADKDDQNRDTAGTTAISG